MSDKQTANMEIKRFNHTSIFRLLREDSLLTKQDIVNALQLCLPTVTQNINELREEGLVTECGTKGNTGGRRAITYGIVPDARLAIGLDITRNHVTCVIVDLTGAIIYQRRERKKFENSDLYYRYLGETVRVAVAALSIPRDRVLGVGIGIPGLVTADNQTVFYGEILNFTG
ncbi:MAG: sugar kinase, partial [Oscillospiraceae bacterium]